MMVDEAITLSGSPREQVGRTKRKGMVVSEVTEPSVVFSPIREMVSVVKLVPFAKQNTVMSKDAEVQSWLISKLIPMV